MSRSFVTSDGVVADVLNKHENYLLDNYILQNRAIPVEVFGATRVAAISDGIDYLTSVGGGRIFVPADGTHFELEIRVHKDRNGAYHTNFEYHYDRQPTTEARPYTDEEWQVGDTIFNNQPNIDKCMGWVCTTAGTPGTWTPFGYTKKWFSEIEVIDALPDPSELQLGRQVLVKESDGVTRMYFCISTAAGVYSWVEKMLNGKSAYELAVDAGFEGTEEEWIASLKGETGDTGNTYIQETPLFANSVEECIDTSKIYVLPDGMLWAYITKEVPEVTIAKFTNQIPISTGSDNAVYTVVNDDGTTTLGYAKDTKISSSGGATTSAEGYGTTGFIPIGYGSSNTAIGEQVIYLADIEVLLTDTNARIAFYDTNKTYLGIATAANWKEEPAESSISCSLDNHGYVDSIDVSAITSYYYKNLGKEVAYFRICAPGLDAASIIAVNELIEYITTGGETINGWTNTGHAFVPADYEDRIVKEEAISNYLLNEVESIQKQITKEEATSTYILSELDIIREQLASVPAEMPDYILEEVARVVSNVQATRTAKSLVFPIMSDIHIYDGSEQETHLRSQLALQYASISISELRKRMHLDFVGYLGDYTWGSDDFSAEQVMRDLLAVKETSDNLGAEIWCVGNHDLNYGANRDRLLTLDEIYSYIGVNSDSMKPYESIERGYGYTDFDNQKIRVIYLNTCDVSDWVAVEGEDAPASWISPTQLQWLADEALNFSDKSNADSWGVVILSHHPLHYSQSCFDCTLKILEAYKDGLSGRISCTIRVDTAEDGTKTYPQQSVSYDFSNSERAEIICNIHGHNHNCSASQISSTTRLGTTDVAPWLWRFCIPQICASRYNTGKDLGELYGEYDESGNPIYWYKETGTAKATSFCVINIDRKYRKIHAYIFGAGTDREISY